MEELKKNTEIEKQKQIHESLVEFIVSLEADIEERDRWHERSRSLELCCLALHWAVIIYFALNDMHGPAEIIIKDLSFILFIVCAARSMTLMGMWQRALGRYYGAIEMLRRLGGYRDWEDPGEKKRKRKWNPFARYKEFWERMGAPNKKEAYA